MKKKNFNIIYMIFILLLGLPAFSYAQSKTITGTVVSKTDSQPLPSASVLVKGGETGATTDFDGNYSVKAKTGDILIFSYIGFKSLEVKVVEQTVINVSLEEDAALLDEIVITGYGKQSRAQLTTSVSKLDTKVLQNASRSNAASALQGTVAGLRVTNTTGQPGSTPQIVLRGGTGFNGTGSPLILVDGIPGSFYGLNPDDIESIEVLKDAAATAIYGARSSDGVILVTTKTGKSGKSSINYKYRYSMNSERDDQKYIGAADHINYNRQSIAWFREVAGNPGAFSAFLNGNHSAATGNNATTDPFTTQLLTSANRYLLNQPGWESIPDVLNPSQNILFYNDGEIGDRIYQSSEIKDHYISFDGGNEKGTYYLGLGVLDNDGLILGSGFKRYSGKFSGSYKIKENFKINSNILYTHSNLSRSPLGGDDTVFRRFQGQAATSRTFNSNLDGTFSKDYATGQNQSFGNPLYYQDKFVRKNLEQRLAASVGLNWDILDDLTFAVTGSHFTINNHNENFNRAFRVGNTDGPLRTARQASANLTRTLRNQFNATLNYTRSFGDHNLNLLVGTEYFKDNRFSFSAATRNSPTDLIETLNAGAEADGIPSTFETEYSIISAFGRVLYDYDNKYLFSFNFRNDGTSRLGNNKYGFFPGVSLGWNTHKEEFFQNSSLSKYVNRLKPRLSYGINGNVQSLSNYGVYGAYGSQTVYNGQTGYANTVLPTLDLFWEKSTTFNAGLDVSFLDNRVSVIADVYTKDVKDKHSPLALPYYTGFTGITTNNGTIRNKGFELQINADIIRNDDFTWNVGATFTRNRSYIQKLPDSDNERNRQGGQLIWNTATGQEEWVGGFQEGQRSGHDLVVAFEQEGIYSTQAEADADNGITDMFMPAASRNKRWAGDVKWKDQNGDGIINNLDRKVIGRTTPDFVGGITTNFTYKNFSLFVVTDFATGHLVWNHIKNKGYGQTQGNLAQPIEVLESWTPNNPNASLPRFVFVNGAKNVWRGNESIASLQNFGNNKFWEKGDYLALREVTFRYSVPTEYLKNTVKQLSIFATGSNLHYFKSVSGDTPEVGGVQYGQFPVPRTITLGVNLTF